MNSKYTILCIDDEVSILNALKRIFFDKKYNAITTTNGEHALKILKSEKVNVIISDQRMPGMTGIEILKSAKIISPDTVRIMLTGYADFNVTIEAINEGEIYKYINKPWDDDELLKIIEDIIRKQDSINYKVSDEELERRINDVTDALKIANFNTIRALSSAIEINDKYTKGHCDRVMEYAIKLAEKLKINSEKILNLKYASLLHDIGKIGVPANILNKESKLDDNEWEIIKRHPVEGAKIINNIEFLKNASRIVLEHHECIDGTGYPYGKKGNDLLLESKILTIADVFDALTSDRAYRKALSTEKAIEILLNGKNKLFDKKLIDIFIDEIKK